MGACAKVPRAIPHACRKHGCRNTTTDRSGYCDEHRNTGWENHQQGKSRHERGYGSKWIIIRAAFFTVISTFAKPACVKVEPYPRPRLTISNLRAMAEPMMTPTLRDCAGLAIEPRPPESGWDEGEGGIKSLPLSA